MDEPEQARAYAQADFDDANSLFVRVFSDSFPRHDPVRVIDLGCGPADIPVRFARRYPSVRVTAVDGSQAMLAHARSRINAERLGVRVDLVQWCLADPVPPGLSKSFDTVLSNSLLHHLHDPGRLWRVIEELAAPGAAVMTMDLARPATERDAAAIVEKYSGDEPDVLRRDFYNSLLAAFRIEEVRAQLAGTALETLQVTAVSDRHLAVIGNIAGGGRIAGR